MDCEVMIVGAGPTGLMLAGELRRRDVECLLIDALAAPQHWDRATVIHPRSLEVFEALGIVDRFLAAGVPQRGARLHSAGEVLVDFDFSRSGSPYPYNLGLSEEATERFLTEHLHAFGGRVERSTRFLALTQDDDGITARVERGGVEEEIRAGWVVGCGGYHSPIREEVGIAMEGHDLDAPWAVFDATLAGRTDDFETTLVYLEETMVILTPLPGHRFRVYSRPRDESVDFVAASAAVLARYLPGQALTEIENPGHFRCHSRIADSYRAGRVLLAGDAAHVCSPSQGHGMNSGIQDAFNLGWKLALVCQGDAEPSLLDSYEVERRPVAAEIVAAGEGMEQLGDFEGEDGRARRDAEVRASLNDPEVAHTEAVAEAELNIDYGDSPVVAGNRGGPLGPGGRLPDLGPVTAAPGEPQVRLHQLAHRPGHTLLAIAVGDGGKDLPHFFAQLEALVARSPHLDAAFALVTAPGATRFGTIHPDAAAALGVGSVALLAVRPDRHVGLFADDPSVADAEDYSLLLRGQAGLPGA